jgi:hypothetical protein
MFFNQNLSVAENDAYLLTIQKSKDGPHWYLRILFLPLFQLKAEPSRVYFEGMKWGSQKLSVCVLVVPFLKM